jgi:hypothetical protein
MRINTCFISVIPTLSPVVRSLNFALEDGCRNWQECRPGIFPGSDFRIPFTSDMQTLNKRKLHDQQTLHLVLVVSALIYAVLVLFSIKA